jgi:hypothetical protein
LISLAVAEKMNSPIFLGKTGLFEKQSLGIILIIDEDQIEITENPDSCWLSRHQQYHEQLQTSCGRACHPGPPGIAGNEKS